MSAWSTDWNVPKPRPATTRVDQPAGDGRHDERHDEGGRDHDDDGDHEHLAAAEPVGERAADEHRGDHAGEADEPEQRDRLDGRVTEADVVREDEQLVPGDGEVAGVEQQATREGPEEVGVLDRVDPERAEERPEVEAVVDLVAAGVVGVEDDEEGDDHEGDAREQHVRRGDVRPQGRARDLAAERAEHGAGAGERREGAAGGVGHPVGEDGAEGALREVVRDLHDREGDGDLHDPVRERHADEREAADERARDHPGRPATEARARAVGDHAGEGLRDHRREGADGGDEREVGDLVRLVDPGDLEREEDAGDGAPQDEDREVGRDDPAEQAPEAARDEGAGFVDAVGFEGGGGG